MHTSQHTQRPIIMQRLKSETQDLHDAAESHELQRKLMKGELSRELYAAHLGQLYLVHKALESAIRDAQTSVPALQTVVHDYQFQVPYLEEDLAFYGLSIDSLEPTPGTARLIEKIEQAAKSDPIALLGFQYVLEGSNNGSKYIAKAVSRAYQIESGPGLRYLDPYGDNQRAYWGAFIADMAKCSFSDAQSDALVDAAGDMFRGIAEIGDDLLEPTPA